MVKKVRLVLEDLQDRGDLQNHIYFHNLLMENTILKLTQKIIITIPYFFRVLLLYLGLK